MCVESPAAENKAGAVQAGVGGGVLLWERVGGPWAPAPQGRLLPLARGPDGGRGRGLAGRGAGPARFPPPQRAPREKPVSSPA